MVCVLFVYADKMHVIPMFFKSLFEKKRKKSKKKLFTPQNQGKKFHDRFFLPVNSQ